jgi:mannose-6-phosphate isomerase
VLVHGGGQKNDATQIEGVYVIESRPRARVVSGTKLRNNLELFESIAENTIEDSFYYLDVKAGDAFLVPPGTLHAAGEDMLMYSITTPLIETSSIYDWGRYGELNIDKAIDSFRYDYSISTFEHMRIDDSRELVLESELFRLERIDAMTPLNENADDCFCAYTAFTPGRIDYDGRSKHFAAGDTFLIPAGLGAYTITSGVLLKACPR